MEIGAVLVAASWAVPGRGAAGRSCSSPAWSRRRRCSASIPGPAARTSRRWRNARARLEFERDQQAQLAAAAERASIAREVHDVVTHSLSVMVALTDGASYAVHTAPDRAAEAVAKASEVGRQAIADMQRVLGVLRGSAGAAMAELHPQPGLAQLDALLAEVRVAGLPVELVVGGARPDLSSGVELAVFRVVQEALTNTRKHAEPGRRRRVRLDFGADADRRDRARRRRGASRRARGRDRAADGTVPIDGRRSRHRRDEGARRGVRRELEAGPREPGARLAGPRAGAGGRRRHAA